MDTYCLDGKFSYFWRAFGSAWNESLAITLASFWGCLGIDLVSLLEIVNILSFATLLFFLGIATTSPRAPEQGGHVRYGQLKGGLRALHVCVIYL